MALAAPLYLADKSALARMHQRQVEAVLTPLIADGLVALCGAVELEVLYSSRSAQPFQAQVSELRGYPYLDTSQADFDRAIEVMGALAHRGQHRAAGLTDLLLAAVAERHGVTILHYDGDFDLITAVTGQAAQWVVPRGSVP